MNRKKLPAAFAVVSVPKATKIAAAAGKVKLMESIHELSRDGEKMLAFLFRVMDGAGDVDQGLKAAQLLLAYGYGKPVEVQVTADASSMRPPGAAQLTSEQLHAAISGFASEETDAEITLNSESSGAGAPSAPSTTGSEETSLPESPGE